MAKTYRDLFNELAEDQMDQPIKVAMEGKGLVIKDFWILEEDHVDPTGLGLEPISVYSKENDKFYNEDEGTPCVEYKKGTAFLVADE